MRVEPAARLPTSLTRAFGGQTMTGRLKRVMVRKPAAPKTASDWTDFRYRHPVDHPRAVDKHAALVAILESEGVDVIVAADDESGDLDAIFPYDPSLTTDQGAILLSKGKPLRVKEPAFHARTYGEIDVPVLGEVVTPRRVEGGDTLWLDERTVAVGRISHQRCGHRAARIDSRTFRRHGAGIRPASLEWPGWVPAPDVIHQPGAAGSGGGA